MGSTDPVTRVRRFNRAVAREIGALDVRYLGRGRPLGSARVLCAIGAEGRDLAGLRTELELDAGLISRILAGLAREGLVTVTATPEDRRQRRVAWTESGRAEAEGYDALSDSRARRLLESQGRNSERVLAAMDLVAAALNRAHVEIVQVDPSEPDARDCVARYFAELASRFEEGFEPGRALQPDEDAIRPPNGACLLARADGQVLGSVAVRRTGPDVADLKRLWVAPASRGLGIATRLVAAGEDAARGLGAARIRLDTNRALTDAIALYRTHGYVEVPAFNSEPYAHHWFEKRL